MKHIVVGILLVNLISYQAFSQNANWQQRVEYKMEIDMDVETNQFTGVQQLKYFNNSFDTLYKVYYHLYFNAFQPGSMMDVRSRTIQDPSKKIEDRIYNLKEGEQGWHKVLSLKQDGIDLNYEVSGTVLEVTLAEPILSNSVSIFEMNFESQVPLQVRRSGRDNKEGIRYSMSQWFPKMAEYDEAGWHTPPYILREFYGPWGDYEVDIKIDKKYVVGGSGVLQNPNEIGHGYAGSKGKTDSNGKLNWKFKAEKVHDFVWAADPGYKHGIAETKTGTKIHYLHQKDTIAGNWKKLHSYVDKTFSFLSGKFGPYPYSDYSIIQGGDGGTEYPMATLITGHRSFRSLLGVSVHEICHNWLPMLVATNETYLAWIDEGFADYTEEITLAHLFPEEDKRLFESSHKAYFSLVKSAKEEPLSTHADNFSTNKGYLVASYSKGAITFHQLSYIIGTDVMHSALKKFFKERKFKHADKNDFIRVFEKESGLVLDWYFDYWINSTKTIDYAIRSISSENDSTTLQLERKGEMPMPLEIEVRLKNGNKKSYYIALGIMRGEKKFGEDVTTLTDWPWVNPFYTFDIPFPLSEIESIGIDPSQRMADVDRSNNVFPFDEELRFKGQIRK